VQATKRAIVRRPQGSANSARMLARRLVESMLEVMADKVDRSEAKWRGRRNWDEICERRLVRVAVAQPGPDISSATYTATGLAHLSSRIGSARLSTQSKSGVQLADKSTSRERHAHSPVRVAPAQYGQRVHRAAPRHRRSAESIGTESDTSHQAYPAPQQLV